MLTRSSWNVEILEEVEHGWTWLLRDEDQRVFVGRLDVAELAAVAEAVHAIQARQVQPAADLPA